MAVIPPFFGPPLKATSRAPNTSSLVSSDTVLVNVGGQGGNTEQVTLANIAAFLGATGGGATSANTFLLEDGSGSLLLEDASGYLTQES